MIFVVLEENVGYVILQFEKNSFHETSVKTTLMVGISEYIPIKASPLPFFFLNLSSGFFFLTASSVLHLYCFQYSLSV